MEKLKIGDVVTIRQWDDMASEYGINAFGDIRPSVAGSESFVEGMKEYCGCSLIIANIMGDYFGNLTYILATRESTNCDLGWSFQEWMFDGVCLTQESEYQIDFLFT